MVLDGLADGVPADAPGPGALGGERVELVLEGVAEARTCARQGEHRWWPRNAPSSQRSRNTATATTTARASHQR